MVSLTVWRKIMGITVVLIVLMAVTAALCRWRRSYRLVTSWMSLPAA